MKLSFRVTAVFLFLLFWGRLVAVAVAFSATFDEPLHLLQAALFWHQWPLLSVVQNPPLVNGLMGLPMHLAFDLALPTEMTPAVFQDWLTLGGQFLWRDNPNGLHLLFVGRLAIVWLALLLGALLVRWAGQWFGWGGGLVTLLLYTFDPNVLTHGALATTDMGTAVFMTLAAYLIWRYWALIDRGRQPAWKWYLVAGTAVGLALAAKFSGVILLLGLALILFWRLLTGQEKRGWKRPLLEMAGWVVIAIFVFLLFYRFNWAALQMDFGLQQAHQREGHSSFLLGQTSVTGWWYYFPTLFAVKTPLPLLLLLLAALVPLLKQRLWGQVWLWLLVGGFVAASLVSRVNIGYRYLLPILPLLFVSLGAMWQLRTGWRWAVSLCLVWLVAESAWYHPDYLAYFNQLAGGPANGWQVAVDSNLDWGQDVAALAAYERDNLPEPYQVAWLGTAPLAAYGIQRGQAMPVWPQGREDPLTDSFYPPAPAPGKYVISATQLHGVYLKNQARFAWFQTQTPAARLGYSLFVYEVPPTGPSVGLALSGIGPAMIAAEDYAAAFQSNDVQPRWFDARTSMLWSGGGSEVVWTAVGDGHLPNNALLTELYPSDGPALVGSQEVAGQMWRYNLYVWPRSPLRQLQPSTEMGWSPDAVVGAAEWAEKWQPLAAQMANFSNTLGLFGYQVVHSGDEVEVLGLWQLLQPLSGEHKIFVHLVDGKGELVAQHDGFDLAWRGMRVGDEFAQLHIIQLPADLPSGSYGLQIGVYQVEDGVRLPLAVPGGVSDRVLLQVVSIKR